MRKIKNFEYISYKWSKIQHIGGDIMSTFVNLCPHQVDIIMQDGQVNSIKPSGQVARCAQSNVVLNEIDGIQITRQVMGEVQNLPDEIPGVLLIVSRIVAQAKPERHDLVVPGPLVRDQNGQPCGCQGLSVCW